MIMKSKSISASRAATFKSLTAEAVPIIKEMQAQGTISRRKIADSLTARGIPAPRGEIWSPEHVKRVLELVSVPP